MSHKFIFKTMKHLLICVILETFKNKSLEFQNCIEFRTRECKKCEINAKPHLVDQLLSCLILKKLEIQFSVNIF
jgi:hypothetical protein